MQEKFTEMIDINLKCMSVIEIQNR